MKFLEKLNEKYRKLKNTYNKLSKTLQRLWNYDYIWESWAKIL